jgi:hypothetical protein
MLLVPTKKVDITKFKGKTYKSDGLLWSRICVGKQYIYSVREDGKVMRCDSSYHSERYVAVYLKHGHATVKINNREHRLKNLVAKHFLSGWVFGSPVECIDGNPLNCNVRNLRIYSKKEHGIKNGWKSRSQPVIINGVEYRSIREGAKAIYTSYQTISDYINGNVKKSCLDGYDIRLAG